MKRYVAALLVLISLTLPVRTALALQQDAGEGYARPTFPELVQTMVLLNGFDISNPKVADEYARIVYCDLYRKNFGNDIVWDKIRNQIVTRALKRREYFRVKYEVVGMFNLGRYDFKEQFFPISNRTSITNVGSVSLLIPGEEDDTDCTGRVGRPMFPTAVVLDLNEPLTVKGFAVPMDKVEKMMVRIEEAGNRDRRVYGRIRVLVTDAKQGQNISKENNAWQMTLEGKVESVDFFIDRELTKPIGKAHIIRE